MVHNSLLQSKLNLAKSDNNGIIIYAYLAQISK